MSQQAEISTLLRSKLHRPQVTEALLPRPRLLEHLHSRRRRPLTLVVAPAGYGKTTLVSSWLQVFDWPSAWLSLDKTDNDLVVFLSYFIAAIQTVFPQEGQETLALLKAPKLPPLSALIRSLINELDQIETAFILVLDDYHHIHEPAVHDLLEELLHYPCRSMHLVLISRTDPPISLARLRARSQLTEIRTHELRFTATETAAFLQQELDIPVNDTTIAAVTKRFEGWAVGLRLVTISLRHRGAVDLASSSLDGEVAYVTDYLIAEVLSQLPPAIKDFLLKTSILERLCDPLCDALSGLDEPVCHGQACLEWLHQQNLFIIPLDDQRQWYRYHHLFQGLLRSQLAQRFGTEDIAALHRRASAWFAHNGFIEDALHHALAADDIPTAVGLVDQHRHHLMNQEQWPRLARWLRLFLPEIVKEYPELLITQAWLLYSGARLPDIVATLDRIETRLLQTPLEPVAAHRLQAEIDVLRGYGYAWTGDGGRTLIPLQQAQEVIPREWYDVRGLLIILLSYAHHLVGNTARAYTLVHNELTVEEFRNTLFHARLLFALCMLHWVSADLAALGQIAVRFLTLGQELDLERSKTFARAYLGVFHYQRNELVEAERYLRPIVTDRYTPTASTFIQSAITLALSYQAQGKPARANETAEQIVDYVLETQNSQWLPTAQVFLAELALQQGRIPEAHHRAQQAEHLPILLMHSFYVPQLTLAKVLLAQDTVASREQAGRLLAELQQFIERTHNHRYLIEVLALQAILVDAQGNQATALDKLEQAIHLAEPGGWIRLFVDLGPRLAILLNQLGHQGIAPDYIGQILAVFGNEERGARHDEPGQEKTQPPSFSFPPLVESLTDRELEVLALLAQRLSNKEIAAQLVISPGTVTQHTHNIYQKLNVEGRRQAVSKAAEIGMLSPLQSSRLGSVAD